ncbi:MAG TPA: GNAT family N-acetyltransferase [Candidatus Nanopelagicales bacterium]|nr:GNAT family N-acetyltransferase [Candidatus Nanopelagicales bacterium]
MTSLNTTSAATTAAASPVGASPTSVPGLLLRPARWPEEATILIDVNNAMRLAGGSLAVMTVDGIRAYYDHLENSDLATDLRIGEVDGRPVAYVRVEWRDEHRGDRAFGTALFRTPDAPAGTFAALLDWAMARHRVNAAAVPPDGRPAVVTATTWGGDPEGETELHSRGFDNVRFGYEMLRPTLDDIPDRELPAGFEVRAVEPGHLRAIFEAEVDAFAGHWGAGPEDGSEERWQEFQEDPFNRDTGLWQVAWAGDAIVGMVRPFINDEENIRAGVRRGWCENISTGATWRGKGVASALICRALRALRDRGMTEAALGVDAQNETGALRLYEAMGFRPLFREVEWRRPLDEPGAGR